MANDSELELIVAYARQVPHPEEMQNRMQSPNPFFARSATPLNATCAGQYDDALKTKAGGALPI
jgi:hypothetical protein